MPTIRTTVLGLACAAVVLGGRAGAADDAKKDRVCISRREINAISALDDRHAFAKLSAERFYMLTLDKTCRELRLARQIELDPSASRVCGDGSSLITFEPPTVGLMRCRIERIDRVKDKNAALDLIDSRAEPTPEPSSPPSP